MPTDDYLLYRENGEERRFGLDPDRPCLIGRSSSCNVRINNAKVSREHAKIVYENGSFTISDCNSRNGTTVNGTPIKSRVLSRSDRIEVGPVLLVFSGNLRTKQPIASSKEPVSFVADGPKQEKFEYKLDEGGGSLFMRRKDSELHAANENLRLIQSLTGDLCNLMDIDLLLDKILKIIIDIYKPEQGAILLLEEDGEKLYAATSHRAEGTGEIVISNTITSEVIDNWAAILCKDIGKDERFREAKSIVKSGIKSTMCAPLISKEKFMGLIYLISFSANPKFTQDGLELLFGLANQASIGLDISQLHKKIEQETIFRNDLKRYLNADFVEHMISKRINLTPGGEKREITVLFSDLCDFSSMSQKHSPETVVSLLNEYFEVMVDAIFAHDGTLDKFVGDELMAVWGNLLPTEDHALLAARAAVEMRKRLAALNEERRKTGQPEFEMRIGINTGEVISGNIGSSKRMEHTVIGDVVNVAKRLEGRAGPGDIFVSDTTYNLIFGQLDAEFHADLQVKGHIAPVPTYKIT